MYVIFGAAGKVGQTTATQLRKASLPVRAVVREPSQGDALARIGCDVALADLHDADALERALADAQAVQMLMPLPRGDAHVADTMRKTVDMAARVLAAHRDLPVLALSDYGAELDAGTGITLLFHHMEAALRASVPTLTLLRSAEHMQNWQRVLPVAMAKGVLPSFHDPVDKRFPTISSHDVGVVSARLLMEAPPLPNETRVVSVEGPARVSANDVAQAISGASGRAVQAVALPRDQWASTLARSGLNEAHARLIMELFDAHNAGRIDVERDTNERNERAFGTTPLDDAIVTMMPSSR